MSYSVGDLVIYAGWPRPCEVTAIRDWHGCQRLTIRGRGLESGKQSEAFTSLVFESEVKPWVGFDSTRPQILEIDVVSLPISGTDIELPSTPPGDSPIAVHPAEWEDE